MSVKTACVCTYNCNGLVLRTRRNASAAKYAFVVVAHDIRRGHVDVVLVLYARVLVAVATEVKRQFLQFAVVVAHAGQAVLFVVGKYEFDRGFAGIHDFLGVGKDFHAFAYGIDTGGNKASCAFDFANADAASADCIDVFEIAKSGNFDARLLCGLQYSNPFVDLNGNIVDFDIDFCHTTTP